MSQKYFFLCLLYIDFLDGGITRHSFHAFGTILPLRVMAVMLRHLWIALKDSETDIVITCLLGHAGANPIEDTKHSYK